MNTKLLYVLVPLLVGAFLYLLFGDPDIWLLRRIGLSDNLQNWLHEQQGWTWIVYNLPDGLWAFSFVGCVILIQKKARSQYLGRWLCLCLAIMVLFEFAQHIDLIRGTADLLDVAFYLIFGIIAYLRLRH